MKSFHVSQSKVNRWRQCRQSYWYRYVEKLRRKRVARPLQFGRMVHEMIEEDANGNDPFKHLDKIAKRDDKMFRSQREEYGDLVRDVKIIMRAYFDYWTDADPKRTLEYVKLKGKSSEHTFEVEISDGIVVEGKIDNIAKTPNKLRWLTEHKSGGKVPNEDHRWRNLQSAVYIRVIDILGLPSLDGTVWDYIRSKAPTRPQLLKGGQLSARGLDTLPEAVLETLRENKIKPSDPKYRPLVKLAEENQRNYFQRIFSPVKDHVVEVLFKGFVNTAREMADLHGKEQHISMNIGRHCDWCDFEPLCRGVLQDLDVDFIKKKEYDVSKGYDRPEPDFEA